MTIDDLMEYYFSNPKSKGRGGMAFDCAFRYRVRDILERCHPAGVTDTVVKCGVAVETKSGCGWLLEPTLPGTVGNNFTGYETKEEAELFLKEQKALPKGKRKKFMCKATHVAYIEQFNGDNLDEVRVIKMLDWLDMLYDRNLIRVKLNKNTGTYGFAIQSYIPTEKFKASVKRYEAFKADRNKHGETIEKFVSRMEI